MVFALQKCSPLALLCLLALVQSFGNAGLAPHSRKGATTTPPTTTTVPPTTTAALGPVILPYPDTLWRIYGPCAVAASEPHCVTSPNYPLNYSNDEACLIRIEGDVETSITFEHFDTELNEDFLAVNGVQYSGSGPAESLSLSGYMTWYSDSSNTSSGWKVCAYPTGAAWGSTVTTTTSTTTLGVWTIDGPCQVDPEDDECITSPNYPADYNNSQQCSMHLSNFSASSLEIVDFYTESGWDKFRVGNHLFSGSKESFGIYGSYFTGNATWHSDSSSTRRGWKVCARPAEPTIWVVEGPCTVDPTEPACIMSPNYPNYYHRGFGLSGGVEESCNMHIVDHHPMGLDVRSFNTAQWDILEVDGVAFSGYNIQSFGEVGTNFTGDMHWHSDGLSFAGGWKICAQSLETTTTMTTTVTTRQMITSEVWTVYGPCGISATEPECITSPNYPYNYNNSQSCEMETVGDEKRVLTIVSFQTESGFDKLTVDAYYDFSGSRTDFGDVGERFSGHASWRSDGSVTYPGWKVCAPLASTTTTATTTTTTSTQRTVVGEYWVVAGPCTISEEEPDCIESPNFGAGIYTDNERCTMHTVNYTATPLDIEVFESELDYDIFTFNGHSFSGSLQTFGSIGTNLTGDIVWTSDGSFRETGWKVCARPQRTHTSTTATTTTSTLQMTYGEFWIIEGPCEIDADEPQCITSPNYPNDYGLSQSCSMRNVDSAPMSLEIRYFSTEYRYDHLDFNGYRFSGYRSSFGVAGMNMTGDITWTSDNMQVYGGWKVCAGLPQTSTTTTTTTTTMPTEFGEFWVVSGPCSIPENEPQCIQSPNFPNDYNNSQRCYMHRVDDMPTQLQIVNFTTESYFDYLTFNGHSYSGTYTTFGSRGKSYMGEMTWRSDSSTTRSGWKICALPPAENEYWVVAGPCTISEEDPDCVQSPNYPSNYYSDQDCVMHTVDYAPTPLDVVFFHTETNFDNLTVNNHNFSGVVQSFGEYGLNLTGNMVWHSDGNIVRPGWKVCARTEVTLTTTTTTTTTTTLHLVVGEYWVVEGACEIDADNAKCVTSPNYPSQYNVSRNCDLHIVDYKPQSLEIIEFNTESDYDYLEVGGVPFSGRVTSFGDPGLNVTSNLHWRSDTTVTLTGWKICIAPPQTSTTTTTTTTTLPMVVGEFWAVGGPCTVSADDAQCIQSPNYPSNYNNSQTCIIHPVSNAPTPLRIVSFNTESGFDEMTINGHTFSGHYESFGESGSLLVGGIFWHSDGTVTDPGWKICADLPSNGTASTSAAPSQTFTTTGTFFV